MEFKAFPKISRIEKAQVSITQKLHGTNAQVLIEENEAGELEIRAGSRNRWIFPDNDNYGFATFVEANKQEFIEKLGPGRHFGEWVGPGINSGEGLEEKRFMLFDWWKYPEERPLPPQTGVVPVLYKGKLKPGVIEEVFEDLKKNGSKLVPGFMRPEGIVVSINDVRYKQTFDNEEVAWKKSSGHKNPKTPKVKVDYSHLLQPLRLEKLLSKDEALERGYPETLGQICQLYMNDLVEEEQIVGDKDQIKAIKKGATGQVFKFIKAFISEKESA